MIPDLYGGNGITLATTSHEAHFTQESLTALGGLGNAIASGINVPFTGTATSSFTFDVQQAVFVRSTDSLGPTLAERADTIGKGKINLAWTYTRLKYTKLEGDNLDSLNLTLHHVDQGEPGAPAFTEDNILVNLDTELSQDAFLFYGKYGITSRWDVGLVLPVIHTKLRVDSTATIQRNSGFISTIDHNFCIRQGMGFIDPGTGGSCAPGSTVSTLNDPNKTRVTADQDRTEFGDLLLTTKYNFIRDQGWLPDMAAVGAVRFDTGDQDNFSGAGNTGFQGYFIASKKLGLFTPHLNLGAELTTDGGFTDVWRLRAGSEFTPMKWVTLSVDVLGQQSFNGNGVNDKLWDIGFGVKVNPWSTLALIGDFVIPLNQDTGLRTDVTWTVGLEYTF